MTQTDADAKPEREPKRRTGPVTFTKQVVGELRKVRWPTRRELVTYTIVVLVFVLIVLGYVSLLDSNGPCPPRVRTSRTRSSSYARWSQPTRRDRKLA